MLAGDNEGVVTGTVHAFRPCASMAHLMVLAGVFASAGEAKRNGWAKPVPPGFTLLTVGKRRLEITIINTREG
jgi:hypothetical protein